MIKSLQELQHPLAASNNQLSIPEDKAARQHAWFSKLRRLGHFRKVP